MSWINKWKLWTCWCACVATTAFAQDRTEYLLDKGWKFVQQDVPEARNTEFDDSRWQSVVIPHDWAIYGPFSIHNDKQNVAITQDGQKEAMEHAGRTGGLPFVGCGWYRLTLDNIPSFKTGKQAILMFDGAMSHAQVYVNGHEAIFWPYGYNSFYVNVTEWMSKDEPVVIAVRLENKPESSRWYPGAGLYRNVHLIIVDEVHVATWGTQITTPVVEKEFAKVNVKTTLEFPEKVLPENIRVRTVLKNSQGEVVSEGEKALTIYDKGVLEQEFLVKQPHLWNCDTPKLYKAETFVFVDGRQTDTYFTTFGIRSIEIVRDKGFYLNGERIVFKGVCNHHDLGPLGAAVNDAAIRRQIRLLKEMGCNAIRTAHNMPAPELVAACDEMGMMLMVESFDEWKIPKMKNGYNLYFDEWIEKDVSNLVRHYRNSPSVMFWSSGNEIPEQVKPGGMKRSQYVQDLFHKYDPTRPCTQGISYPQAFSNNYAALQDVPGVNYATWHYKDFYENKLPQAVLLGSETASTFSSRGIYKFPMIRRTMAMYDDHQCSSYDVEHAAWSDLPEDNFIQYQDLPYDMGEFVWTGFDYLGEPTPYYTNWPNHSSMFGILDLAGLPKDRYYLYRSVWYPEKETLHILPHWNWQGHEGDTIPIVVYTNYPTAEIFINGKSQGKRTKDLSVTLENSSDEQSTQTMKRLRRYRLMWMDTRYEPGTVKAIAYDKDGNKKMETEIHTAGTPHHLELIPDRKVIVANGKDLCFITVKLVDKEGNLCPNAQQLVHFQVKGAGSYRAGANGDPTCLDVFHAPQMHLFNGMMTAIVQSEKKTGKIVLKASLQGIPKAKLQIMAK